MEQQQTMAETDYWQKSLIITSPYPGFQNFQNLQFKSATDNKTSGITWAQNKLFTLDGIG